MIWLFGGRNSRRPKGQSNRTQFLEEISSSGKVWVLHNYIECIYINAISETINS